MASHVDLLTELQLLEKVPTLERLRAAQKRRAQQLKKWAQYEHDLQHRKRKHERKRSAGGRRKKVAFEASVALLEASLRNDAEEGRPGCWGAGAPRVWQPGLAWAFVLHSAVDQGSSACNSGSSLEVNEDLPASLSLCGHFRLDLGVLRDTPWRGFCIHFFCRVLCTVHTAVPLPASGCILCLRVRGGYLWR